MANVYVRSGAGGAATGADWANAYLTLGAALTAKAAGDIFWVSEDHAESTAASVTLSSPGTATAPCFVYCVDHAGTVPPVAADLRTTATVTVAGNFFLKVAASYTFFDGISFILSAAGAPQALTIASGGSSYEMVFKNCSIQQLSTGGGALIFGQAAGNRGGRVLLDNTTISLNATNDYMTFSGVDFVWRNTASAITGATVPTTLIDTSAANMQVSSVLITGVDLSAITGTLFGPNLASTKYVIDRCKINAAATVAAAGTIVAGFQSVAQVDAINIDSAATNYTQQRVRYQGSLVQETTIVRTGGASDGTVPIAWKLVTTANSRWLSPLESFPIAIWNTSTASVTVTVYGIWGGGAVPNNDEIWIDCEYLGSALTPQSSFATSTKATNLTAASALSSDTSTWGGSTTKFKMTATFTPAQKGTIYIIVRAATASTTFYIDPKPVLS